MLRLLVPLLLGVLLRSTGSVPTFFAGAVLTGLGIAIGNVLVPALIRSRFPGRVALMMGLYTGMLQLSGAIGSALTAPLEVDLGWGWAPALGIWALPCLLVLGWWVVLVRRSRAAARSSAAQTDDAPTPGSPTPLAQVVRRPLAWATTIFMGFQSLVFYSLLTWLPEQLVGAGLSASAAGLVLGVFSLVGLPGAFLAPQHATGRHAVAFVAGVYGLQLVALVLFGMGPVAAVVGAILCGISQGGIFSAALTFVAGQPDPHDVPAVSALAQGTGYLIAALGPVAVGGLYAATGGWVVPNLALGLLICALIVLGAAIGRHLHRLSGRAPVA